MDGHSLGPVKQLTKGLCPLNVFPNVLMALSVENKVIKDRPIKMKKSEDL